MNFLEIRQKFLAFFKKHNHTIVSSSPLIPAEDPTLLFTNAGMNQFKDVFLGKETRSYKRATSMQKCVRAGGKHNDLDEVGFTPRHLTFFEMMGNFSFGDYFKKEAIQFAWDFLTKEMELPADKMYVTVYTTDDESYDLWHTMIGLPKERISRLGEKDNFWSMGDTGPCGPCSEIHLDCGAEVGCGQSDCAPGCNRCSRYLEIWNLVFMQYNRQENGELKPLEKTGVDTGMGFERLCMVVQNKRSIFEIDLFQSLIKKIEQISKKSYLPDIARLVRHSSRPTKLVERRLISVGGRATAGEKSSDETKAAFHVLCDHVRSASLIIADGGSPSNEGRGYVLRKIIRRAALFAQKLSDDHKLFAKLAQEFITDMAEIFPELKKSETLIVKVLQNEIDRFSVSLEQGQIILDKYLAENRQKNLKELTGTQVFKLYDTYGFPPELTRVIALENNFSIDQKGFDVEMQQQQKQSGKKSEIKEKELPVPDGIVTTFVGYEKLETTGPLLFVHREGDAAWIVTAESPFYVESGGQVDDSGWVTIGDTSYDVVGLKKVGNPFGDYAIAVKITAPTTIKAGDTAKCVVDAQKRWDAVRNHTATHMLQSALITVLGPQVKQAGSVVHSDYLRFDYTHPELLTPEQIKAVEDLLNQKIQENIKTEIKQSTLEQAKGEGVIAFFGEKYNPENVRVVKIPGFSAELCGGTHAPSTGIIGLFKIISDTALSTGVRRIVALTGPKALSLFQENFQTVKTLGTKFKVKHHEVIGTVKKQTEQLQKALNEIKQLKKLTLKSRIPEWAQQITKVGEIPFLYLELEDLGNDELKSICQELEKKQPGFYFLVSKLPDRIAFIGYVSKEFASKINLRDLAAILKEKHSLRGGGSPTLIQGGSKDVPEDLQTTIESFVK